MSPAKTFSSILVLLVLSQASEAYGISNLFSKWFGSRFRNSRPKYARSAFAGNDISTRDNTMFDEKRGVKMGVSTDGCDDAQTNLEVDWDGGAINYTCYTPNRPILPNRAVESTQHCVTLPRDYYPKHFCMDKALSYADDIPTHGDHRPLWPKFGAYKYVPPQRWLHNIEHGAVVMLYHPCSHHKLVEDLKEIVSGCIRKRIITPYDKLSVRRPLALVAWGCKLEMAYVNKAEVINFIREKGLKGPEGTLPKQGQYTKGLLELAEPLEGSDEMDSVLCPNHPM